MSSVTTQRSLGDPVAGRFRLVRRVGAGGMGEVWVSEQLSLGREVAIKLLSQEIASDPEAALRFEREAKGLSRVDHDHVVRVLDFGNDPVHGWFLATELLEGETLGAYLQREKRLAPESAIAIAVQILDGLSAIHAVDVVHRDLKPDNVMLVARDDGSVQVKLLDFGIVKLLDSQDAELTRTGWVFGTPAYVSPEQALARPVDHRSDLYACGVILYEMLAGRPPFDAGSPGALALLHASEAPPPLPAEQVPEPLARVVERSLEKDPDARWSDAQAMRDALLQAASGLPLDIRLEVARSPSLSLQRLPDTRPFPVGPVPRSGKSATRTVLAVRLAVSEDGAHMDRVKETVLGFRGRIAASHRQGLLAEMISPTDALLCAATLHDVLALEQARAPGEAQLRAAITSGEVMRRGRRLLGQAVGQAGVLVEAAPPGGVLFSHGVYLSMIRSEVRCEGYHGPDVAIGQKVHRLLPMEGGPFPALPFGGRWLHKGRALTPARIVHRIGRTLRGAARRCLTVWRRAEGPALRLAGRAARRPVLSGSLCLSLLLLVMGVAFLAPPRPEAGVEAALAAGRFGEAEEAADAWIRKDHGDPRAHSWKGRVLLAKGSIDEAREMILGALELDPSLARDPGVARAMVRLLDGKGVEWSWLLRHGTPAVEDALVEATRSVRYWQRWNAARALSRLSLEAKVDWVGIHLLDLDHAASCGTKVRAARELATVGRGDERVIPALRAARERGTQGAACNLRETIDRSLAALRR